MTLFAIKTIPLFAVFYLKHPPLEYFDLSFPLHPVSGLQWNRPAYIYTLKFIFLHAPPEILDFHPVYSLRLCYITKTAQCSYVYNPCFVDTTTLWKLKISGGDGINRVNLCVQELGKSTPSGRDNLKLIFLFTYFAKYCFIVLTANDILV